MSHAEDTPELTGSSRTPRGDSPLVRDVLLVALTVSTGAVDALSWLVLDKVFSAFMTGNLVFLGIGIAGAPEAPPVPRALVSIAAFALGAILGARIVRRTMADGQVWPRLVTLALAAALIAQAAFFVIWVSVAGNPSNDVGNVLIALSALAMGMQTTAIFSLGVRAVFTTAATATLATLMGDLAGWKQARGERLLLLTIVVGLFAGAAIGAVLVVNALVLAPIFPLALSAIVVIAAAFAFKPGTGAAPPSGDA